MKRYYVEFDGAVFGQLVWAENKREARKQMQPYARCNGWKITRVTE